MVCIWPLASCLTRCQRCPVYAGAVRLLRVTSPVCLSGDCCCTSCNVLWHQRIMCPQPQPQMVNGDRAWACVNQYLIHRSNVTAAERSTPVCSADPSVSPYFTQQICTWWHFCDCIPWGLGLHREWTPILCTAAASELQQWASTLWSCELARKAKATLLS